MISLYHFKEGTSDKIWGWTKTDDGALSFWGRTQGSLSFKRYAYINDAAQQAEKKNKKGYRQVTEKDHDKLLPEDFVGQLMLAKLGQIKF
jgi:hypothetical protein